VLRLYLGTLLFDAVSIRASPRAGLARHSCSEFTIALPGNILLPENLEPFAGHPGEWIVWLTFPTLGYIHLIEGSAR